MREFQGENIHYNQNDNSWEEIVGTNNLERFQRFFLFFYKNNFQLLPVTHQ